MVRFSRSRVIKASRNRVFQYFIDGSKLVESMPDRFLSWKVLSQEGNVRTVENEFRFLGRRFKGVDREVLTPPERVEGETIGGSGKGTKSVISLTEVPGGTKIEMALEAKGALASILGPIFRKRAEREFDRVLDAIVKNIEAGK